MMLLQLLGHVPENSNKEHNKEYSIFSHEINWNTQESECLQMPHT